MFGIKIIITIACFSYYSYPQFKFLGLSNYKVNKIVIYKDYLFAATVNGVFKKSINSPDTIWSPIGFQESEIKSVLVFNIDTIFASKKISGLNEDTISIFITTNSGINWQPFQNGFGGGTGFSNQVLDFETYPNQSDTIFATGLAQIAKSKNFGSSWNLVWNNWNHSGVGIHFIKIHNNYHNLVWAGGETGFLQPVILNSTNFGLSWKENFIFVGGDNACYSCAFHPSDSNIVYIGMEGRIIKTTNRGENWNTLFAPLSYPYFFGLMVNPFYHNIIYAAGGINIYLEPQDLILYLSEDSGLNWSPIIEGTKLRLGVLDLQMISNDTIDNVFLATGEGVYEYHNVITDLYLEASIINSFSLMQKYPNPFNSNTIIEYSIPKECLVKMKIYDVLGSELLTLVNENKSEGKYQIRFDGTNLPSGIYFYSLIAGNYKEVKKIIKLN